MNRRLDDPNSMRRWSRWLLPLAVLAAVCGPLLADDDEESGATYARVRYVDGALTIEQVSEGEVVEGLVNSPVAAGDRAATTGGRAEIELADSSVVWMDSDTRLEFKSLADAQNRYERTNLLALSQGSIRVESRDPGDPDAVFQIDTEAGSIYLLSAGTFRIDASGAIATLSSLGGVAEFSGDGGSVLIRSGQRSSVQSGRNPSNPRSFNTQRLDDFDRFCVDRADAYLHQGSDETYDEDLPQEVRPYATELSFYGTWHTIPTYGLVWRPHYAGVWSPYHHGYWSWCRHSWVWVSHDPWGWAPYHYGRWDYAANLGWFWMPGTVWSGAWVSFAVGPSYIGWCPLNYWNVPVFHDVVVVNRPTVNIGRLDPRGWQFVPSGRFGLRGSDTVVIRGNRLPRNTNLVVTQRLPQFDPRVMAKQPERAAGLVDSVRRTRIAPPIAQDPGGSLANFRTIERRAQHRPMGPPTVTRPRPHAVSGVTPSGEPGRGSIARPGPRTAPPARGGTASPRTPTPSPPTSMPSRPARHSEPGRGDEVQRPSETRTDGRPNKKSGATDEDRSASAQGQFKGAPDTPRGRTMERLFEGSRSRTPATPPPARPNAPRPDPPKASEPQRPTPPPRSATSPRRVPSKKQPAPNPPPPEDSDSKQDSR
jgi:hypothetical protein